MLQIQLFGPGSARINDKILAGFPQQQAAQLFCYLLLHRNQPQSRERLAAVFWENYPTQTARKYLRNAIWRLRQNFESAGSPAEDFLEITDESIRFFPKAAYALDIETFDEALHACQGTSANDLSQEQAKTLESGIALYRGDMLDGIYEDWTLYERERLRVAHLNALSKLIVFHGLHGNHEAGLSFGEKILAVDPTREKIHREMMWLYWLSGDRGAALAQFKRCKQILREELSIRPMSETRQLYSRMKNYQIDAESKYEDKRSLTKPNGSDPIYHALSNLRRLRKLAENINAELSHLEMLLHKNLPDIDS